ncbi:5'-3' exoribonuclease 1-like [Capricornis sumatraensis]|uniref:5'-3' exoribonuclease 1-like n=1 Tax=Capricornis sumatraensis TaxID=34865 RepID=UPI00360530F9
MKFYPYHYAPFLSDIRNISTLKIHFELGKPFKPFEQLLAVLPAASKNLLPACYQHLMTSDDSPIIEYYPPDFKTDLNGKQQEWEAVVLIPFIDEKRLLEAMETCNHSLKKEERKRNQHSECLMCWFDSNTEFTYPSPWPEKFPPIERCCARYKIISLDAWRIDISKNNITKVDQKALYFCGFPTLKHIKHKSIENIASSVLGKSVFVNWPHLEEARVVGVSDGETKFYLEEPPGTQKLYLGRTAPPSKVVHLGDKEQCNWTKEVQGISEYYLRRKGIIINETSAVVYGQLLTGRKYQINQNGEVRLEKQWSKQVLPFVYQTIVKDIRAFDSRFSSIKTLDDLFPPRSMVFMLGTPYYGCTGEVQDSGDVITEGRIRVVFSIPCEPNLDALIQNQHKYSIKYNPGYVLASRLGVSGYLVSRFTGSIFIGRGSRRNPHGDHKANVGLNLKFNKKNEEVPGYTKKVGNEWMYSSAAEQLLAEYLERAPELFSYIAKNSQEDVFYEDDIWPGENENGAEKVQEIITWLKGHPVSTLSRSSCDLQILDAAIVEKIEEEIEKCKPLEQQHGVIPDRDAEFRLFDRVVNVRENFSVPVGLRGTIIGIKGANREADVLFEVLFDEEFPGGLTIRFVFPDDNYTSCSPGRGYRLPTSALVNLSHGSRSETGNQKLTAIVKPQPAVNHYSSNSSVSSGHLGGLNHSPQSLFVPTQVPARDDDEFCNIWQSLQGSGKIQHFQPLLQEKGAVLPQEISQVTQHHKTGFNDNSVKQRKHEPHRKWSGGRLRGNGLCVSQAGRCRPEAIVGTLKGACTPVRHTPSWESMPACTLLLLVPSPQQWQARQGSSCVSGQALVTCDHSTLNSGRSRSVLGCNLPSPCTPGFSKILAKPGLLFWKMEQQHRPQWTVVKLKGVIKEECKSPKTESRSQKMSNRQAFGGPAKCNIKLLKRNESSEVSENQKVVTGYPSAVDKPNLGIENFLASLNISKENEIQSSHHEEPPSEEHLSPQSFAMKGTRMLKEILKIDSSDSMDHKNEMKQFGNEVTVSSSRRDEYGSSSQPKQNKKLTSYMNKPHSASEYHNVQSMDSVCWPAGQIPPVSTPVTELSRICSLVGMPQPNFSFLRTPQTMTVCQVKLSNGLLVRGPQCHSENEAKEKAALFAIQQLGSLGVNFPLPPPIFPSYPPAVPPGTIPPVFPQPTGKFPRDSELESVGSYQSHGLKRGGQFNICSKSDRTAPQSLPPHSQAVNYRQKPGGWDHYGSNLALGAANIMPSSSHLFGSVPWGPPMPVPGKPFHHTSYAGTMPMAGGMPGGVHNQFIPLQVTKKRVANKKNFENKEPQSYQVTPLHTSQSASSDVAKGIPQETSSASLPSSQIPQPASSFQVAAASSGHSMPHQKSAPSASRRKSRKLAVNFGVSKPE